MQSVWYKMSKPLGLKEYYGQYGATHRELISTEYAQNSLTLISRVNRFLTSFGEYRRILYGWRPEDTIIHPAYPEAKRISKHGSMQAIDLCDPEADLDQFVMDNQKLLESCGLWAEHPATTKGWCHLQSVAPKSGRRIFYP
jgi:hypothetical protein